MARSIPDDRLARLVQVATGVIIDQGFQRTRMDDVAEALGVAKGTVYLHSVRACVAREHCMVLDT